MHQFFRLLNHHYTAVLGCVLVLVGMIYGKFILSVGSILLICRAVLNPEVKTHFFKLWSRKDFLAVSSVFLLCGLSFFWSENIDYWAARMKTKLPFIGMPVAFLAIKNFDRQLFGRLMGLFFGLVCFTALRSIFIGLIDFQNIIENYAKGQVLPLPVHHIRFSLMVVFSICLGTEAVLQRDSDGRFEAWQKYRTPVAVLTVFLVFYLHLLAVRSGLLAFYGVTVFYLIRFLLTERRKIIGLGLVVFFLAGSLAAYKFVPTLKNKVDYTWYSVNIFNKKQQMRELSDSRRLGSILAGIELTKEYPFLGVGMGDVRDKTNEWLVENYPDLKNLGLMPHNQFLWVTTAFGWLGFGWFMAAVLIPVFVKNRWKDSLFFSFHIIIFSSFLVEHTLETQVGTAVYIFPLVMMMAVTGEQRSVDN